MKFSNLIKEKLSALWPMWLLIMLVAMWSIYIQDGYINRDGLLYLKQAYLFTKGSWNEGLSLYPWPFFSILIAIFQKLTSLHLQVVAHGLDLGLFGISTLFYLKTLKLIHNKEKRIIFYGGLILLSFIPIMDDYVGMVLRDHGLWAGCMVGTYFYFKNLKEYSLKNSILWQFGFLFAGLFRPEGLVILVLLPLWNLTEKNSQKFKKLAQDYSLSIISAALTLLSILLLNLDLINIISSSRLSEFLDFPILFLNQLVTPLPIHTDNEFLSNLLDNYSLIFTYAVLLSILIFKWIKGLGVIHGGLFFYSFFVKKKLSNDYKKHIYFLLVVSFILVSINLFNVYVLTNRYWSFHWWWMFILISPILLNLFSSRKLNHLFKYIVVTIIIILFVNVIIDQSSSEERNVAKYISENQLLSVDYQENERIKYLVNFNVNEVVNSSTEETFKYILIKNNNFDIYQTKSIIKEFPKNKPKYILLKNDY